LDLNFAQNKSLIDRVSGKNLITFTRASSGTYVGSDGLIKTATTNEPRFDHNPVTLESLGLLVEEQRTNLLLRSEEFDQSPWASQGTAPTVVTNAFAAPDGTTTATQLTFAAADSRGIQAISVVNGTTYTLSIYARPVTSGSLNKVRLAFYDGVNQFNSNDFTLTSGWQRLSFTFTSANTGAGIFQIRNEFSSANANDIYVWGAQLEVGAFPTSYIPTTATAVTRSADVASITGDNFSRWYRADEGTVYSDHLSFAVPGVNFVGYFNDGTAANSWDVARYQTVMRVFVNSGGVNQATLNTALTTGVRHKTGMAIKADDIAFVADSLPALIGASALVPTGVNNLRIGNDTSVSRYLNGHIRRLTYWPQRLPDSTLQSITL
jgi:hypothetical protein